MLLTLSMKKRLKNFFEKWNKKTEGLWIRKVIEGIVKFGNKINDDQVWEYSAQAAFFIIMSFFPFLMFLLTLLQFLPFSRNELVEAMDYIVPSAVAGFVVDILDEAFEYASGTLLSITIIGILWPASKGTVAIKKGLDKINKTRARKSGLLVRCMSVIYIILFAISIILLLAFYVLGEKLKDYFGGLFPLVEDLLARILSVRLVVSSAFLTLVFMLIYKFLPTREPTGTKIIPKGRYSLTNMLPDRKVTLLNVLPGAVTAAFGWIFFSYLFSYFIANLSNMSATYGSLTTIIVCMIWLEFCMFILFMGAELNVWLNSRKVQNWLKKVLTLRKEAKGKKHVMKETSLVFTGDIGFDKYMSGRWKDPSLVSGKVKEFLSSGDHLIINVEGPLSDGEQNSLQGNAGTLIHSMSPEAADFFDEIKADVWNICNNHIMDAGAGGMEDTLANAKKHNVMTLGAGMNLEEASRPVFFEGAGGIGMIGVGYQRACRKAGEDTPGCFSWSDMELIRERISEIKKTCRWCIVVAHGGEEFTCLPSPYTRERYIEYLNMGADVVVSHHPHVPLNYEMFPGKAIFYSLGNFIFDTDYQRSQYNTESGVLLKLTFTNKQLTFEPLGIKINREKECIEKSALPDIFTDVREKDYNLLEPLAAKVFVENTKRQLRYMKPDKFNEDTTEEEFVENFYEPLRSGRVPGECLDMQIMYPLAQEAAKGAWENSKLDKVKDYMLKQL